MKSIAFALSLFALSASASALPIACKSPNEATGQGYEVALTKGSAVVRLQGRRVAKLRFSNETIAKHPDGQTVRVYEQAQVNGYQVVLTTGGLIGRPRATLYRGGVAGYTSIAELWDCR